MSARALSICQPDLKESKDTWTGFQTRYHRHRARLPKLLPVETADDLQSLSLPKLDVDRKTELRDFWKVQTYQAFAENLQRKNPHANLTKQSVDAAFEMAASRISEKKGFANRESAVARVSPPALRTMIAISALLT